jgi:hypothetical protein
MSAFNYLNTIQQDLASKLIKKREEQIVNTLKDHGYEFVSQFELHEFLKTRCKIAMFRIGWKTENTFYVDDKPIFKFSDEINIINNTDDSYKITITLR